MKSPILVAVGLLSVVLVSCASRNQDSYAYQNKGLGAENTNIYGARGSSPETPISGSAGQARFEWPRVVVNGLATNTIYQPQVESWDGTNLIARSAVAVQTSGLSQPVYGLVTFRAKGMMEPGQQLVRFEGCEILRSEFPSAPNRANELAGGLQASLTQELRTMSLTAIELGAAANSELAKAQAQPLNNTPPKVIISTKPAVLVSIDGTPAYRDVPNTQLQRIINSRILMLRDSRGRHYLHVLDGYMQAPELKGPWTVSGPPIGAPIAEKQAQDSGQVDMLEGQPDPVTNVRPSLGMGDPPLVYVSTEPAELITFSGEPNYISIPGTQLLYATNTTGNVFKLLTDQQNYILLSGRWFKASSLNGPWQFEPGSNLPSDFAQIPDSSPKENVKASVPGTAQAREAFIANSIPQTAVLPRGGKMEDPRIDGPPQLSSIEGTPLQYVVNAATPIIKVDEKSWYACQNGVWYVATSVKGPWSVADSVPAVIYSIPSSSPMHYVTYVRVYDADSRVVYQGYTPGYLGTVVSDGVVVYGTGYYYQPWIGSVWYGPPVTWGYGCAPFWSPWVGWSFGFGFGWTSWGYYGYPYYWACYPYPYWGPYGYYGYYGGYYHNYDGCHTGANVYRPPVQAAQSGSNWRSGYGRAYNSRTGAIAAGERGQVQNALSRGQRVSPIRQREVSGDRAPMRSYVRDRSVPGGWRAVTPRESPAAPATRAESDDSSRSYRDMDVDSGRYAPPVRSMEPGMRSAPSRGSSSGGGPSRGTRP
jgi:hypothetical protein